MSSVATRAAQWAKTYQRYKEQLAAISDSPAPEIGGGVGAPSIDLSSIPIEELKKDPRVQQLIKEAVQKALNTERKCDDDVCLIKPVSAPDTSANAAPITKVQPIKEVKVDSKGSFIPFFDRKENTHADNNSTIAGDIITINAYYPADLTVSKLYPFGNTIVTLKQEEYHLSMILSKNKAIIGEIEVDMVKQDNRFLITIPSSLSVDEGTLFSCRFRDV